MKRIHNFPTTVNGGVLKRRRNGMTIRTYLSSGRVMTSRIGTVRLRGLEDIWRQIQSDSDLITVRKDALQYDFDTIVNISKTRFRAIEEP